MNGVDKLSRIFGKVERKMNDDHRKAYEQTIIVLCVMMAVLAVAMIFCAKEVEKTANRIQGEAVSRGFADFVPDEKGRPQFKWREPKREEVK